MNDKKLWKCICKETEITVNDEVLIGYFGAEYEDYFKGVSFYMYKGNWAGGDSMRLSREAFEKVVVKLWEV